VRDIGIDEPSSIRSIAIIANSAFSIHNFRGPLISEMVARGITVHALAPDYDETSRDAVRSIGATPVDISLDRTGLRPLRDLADLIGLVRTLRRLQPDATFGYFIKPVIYGSMAARIAGVRRRFAMVAGLGYVFTSDGSYMTRRRSLLRWLTLRLYRVAFSLCERVFFQNPDDIDHFVSAGTLRRAKAVRLMGTGVDLERFAPARPVLRPIRFLLVARLLREKGISEFVDAARLVAARHPECEFILAGNFDPNPGGIPKQVVEEWVAEGSVQWLGHVDDIRPVIANSSIFVLPSYREGSPRSTQEAMAMERPIITTDAVGCRQTVEEGVNGFLVPVRDAYLLAQAMLKLVEAPHLIPEMGRQSRRLAEDRFDVRRVNATMLAAMGIRHERAAAASE